MLCLVAAALSAPQYQYQRPNQAAAPVSADQWAAMNPVGNSDLDELKSQWARFLE